MTGVTMAFMIVCGAVFQAVIPSWPLLGEARVPVLLGLVLYYALTRSRGTALRAAVLAGLLQDGLCMIPLGYSSFCFCLVSLMANRVKDEVFAHQWPTHMLFGTLSNAAVTVVLAVLLAHGAALDISPQALAHKVAGGVVLAMAVVPLVFAAAEVLERRLGLVRPREAI